MVAILFGIVFTATDMVVPYILTNGGPFNSTQVLTTYAFQTGINAGNIGEGAAIALFLLPVLAFVAVGMLVFARRAEVDVSDDALAHSAVLRTASRAVRDRARVPVLLDGGHVVQAARRRSTTRRRSGASDPTLANYGYLFHHTDYVRVAPQLVLRRAVVVLITLVVALPAGYALARLSGRVGRDASASAIFLTYLVPPTLLFLPLSRVISQYLHLRTACGR